MSYCISNDPKGAIAHIPPLVWLLAAVLLAVTLSIVVWTSGRNFLEVYRRYSKYDTLIEDAARRNGIDALLIKAVIWRESRFQRESLGSKGEVGLMQIMPKFAAKEWAEQHDVDLPCDGALSDPALNIEIGTWFLSRALNRWKDYRESVALALCEYNAGQSRANHWRPISYDGTVLDRIDIASTLSYVNAIQTKYDSYKEEARIAAEKEIKK